jgi:hypothetical protein
MRCRVFRSGQRAWFRFARLLARFRCLDETVGVAGVDHTGVLLAAAVVGGPGGEWLADLPDGFFVAMADAPAGARWRGGAVNEPSSRTTTSHGMTSGRVRKRWRASLSRRAGQLWPVDGLHLSCVFSVYLTTACPTDGRTTT